VFCSDSFISTPVYVTLQCQCYIIHTPSYTGPESLGLEVVNIDTITSQDDTDFGMQLSSAVKDPESSDAVFYTDLNGFTMYKVALRSLVMWSSIR